MSANPEVNPYSPPKVAEQALKELAEATSARVPMLQGAIWVGMAAFAMVATLPGRTHGLGMATEGLLKDLDISQVTFGRMNMGATLIGALFCLPIGWMLDRWGSRAMLTLVAAALGAVVWLMSGVVLMEDVDPWLGLIPMFIMITLTRGLGQSALSVVSISMIGKKFTGGLAWATAAYSVTMSLGFAAAFGLVGRLIRTEGWRDAWANIGLVLLFGLAPLAWFLLKQKPVAANPDQTETIAPASPANEEGLTLAEAMSTPAFWIFAGATSLYGLAVSGIGLFNQSILAERGFTQADYHQTLTVSSLISLAAQFATGALASRWSFQRLIALAMALYAAGLIGLTCISERWQLWTCVILLGSAGGIIIVTFFAIWTHAFGRAHLGRIQGIAQMTTVFASSLGPVLFAECKAHDWGSLGNNTYSPVLYLLAIIVILFGVAAWFVQLPKRSTLTAESEVPSTA